MRRTDVVRDYGGVTATNRRSERRRQLLAAARQIWGESGITEVKVRNVCSAAGLISRYFYEHFPNREAVLFAVFDDVRNQLLDTLVTTGLGESGTIAEKVRAALTALLDFAAADPHIHRIVTSDLTSVPGLSEHRTQGLEMVTELIVQYAPGALGDDTPDPTELRRGALFIVGGVNQVIETWLANPTETPAELAANCADLCVAVVQSVVGPSQQHTLAQG